MFFVFIMISAVTLVAQGLFSPSRYQRTQVMIVLGAAGFPMLAMFIGITFSDVSSDELHTGHRFPGHHRGVVIRFLPLRAVWT